MGRIPEEKVDDIRERTDIVEVVSSYLPLKRSGANHLGLCPFHSEKTPSFNVNGPRQIFHCFGCGVGGNVFSFVMRMEGLSFPEAARRLGERVGIEVEEETLSPAEQARRDEMEQLARVSAVAAEFYHRILLDDPEGAPARRYLRERGYDGEIARRFHLGFAPPRFDALASHLAQKGFETRWAREKLGLLREGKEGRGDYDLFRNRLLFPVIDLRGQVAAFGGRVLDDSLPKYINSPESPLYHKGRVLYGLYQARETLRQGGEAIVVEGYFDQLALVRAGFPNAVATCGTALTEEHGKLLKRYAERVLLLFDQDSAGRKATFRAMEVLLAAGMPAAVVELDAGEDPDSFLKKRGADVFRERLAQARPVLELYIDSVLGHYGEGVEGRARAVETILPKLGLIQSDIERQLYVQALAKRTGLDEAMLRPKAVAPAPAPVVPTPSAPPPPQQQARQERRPEPIRSAPRRKNEGPSAGAKAQELLLHLMAVDGRARGRVAEEGVDALFVDLPLRKIAEVAAAVEGVEINALEQALHSQLLDEEQKALISGILIRDGGIVAEDPEKIFDDCRRAVEREVLERRIRQLDDLLKEALKNADGQQANAYMTERMEINRKLKSGTTAYR